MMENSETPIVIYKKPEHKKGKEDSGEEMVPACTTNKLNSSTR